MLNFRNNFCQSNGRFFFPHGEFVCFEFQERSKSKPNWSGK